PKPRAPSQLTLAQRPPRARGPWPRDCSRGSRVRRPAAGSEGRAALGCRFSRAVREAVGPSRDPRRTRFRRASRRLEWRITMKLDRLVATTLAAVMACLVCAGPVLAAAKPVPTGKVNVNTATAEQLTALPGVGPKLAARIVEHRQKEGAFHSVQDLLN